MQGPSRTGTEARPWDISEAIIDAIDVKEDVKILWSLYSAIASWRSSEGPSSALDQFPIEDRLGNS